MALITSDCCANALHEHQTALITSGLCALQWDELLLCLAAPVRTRAQAAGAVLALGAVALLKSSKDAVLALPAPLDAAAVPAAVATSLADAQQTRRLIAEAQRSFTSPVRPIADISPLSRHRIARRLRARQLIPPPALVLQAIKSELTRYRDEVEGRRGGLSPTVR